MSGSDALTSDATRAPRRARLQAGARTGLDADSRTSRSRSRSSRSWPGASRASTRRLEQRRADRDLDRLAADLPGHPRGRRQHVRARVRQFPTAGGPYWWAHKLGGAGLVVVHRLVQRPRPGRDRRLGRLHPRVLPERSCSASGARHPRLHQLRRRPAHHPGDLLLVRDPPRAARDDQHLLPPIARVVQQASRSGGTWSGSCDHPRDPDHRPRLSPERGLRLHRAGQQLRLRRRRHQRLGLSGSSSCRSASC